MASHTPVESPVLSYSHHATPPFRYLELSLTPSGLLTVKSDRSFQRQMEQNEQVSLFTALEESGFFSLNGRYEDATVIDGFGDMLSVSRPRFHMVSRANHKGTEPYHLFVQGLHRLAAHQENDACTTYAEYPRRIAGGF